MGLLTAPPRPAFGRGGRGVRACRPEKTNWPRVYGQSLTEGEVIREAAVSIPMNARRGDPRVGSQPWALTVDEIGGPTAAETALLKAGQTGDRSALDQLLMQHERRVLAVCHGILGHAEDAEDAAQETLYRALRALPRFRGDASFRTWLLRIAVNVSLNWKRNRRPTEVWDPEDPSLSPEAASPEQIALLRLEVSEALSLLSPERRAI